MYGWFLANDVWGEAVLGVSKSVRPWLWGAVAAGIETDDDPWRGSGTVVGAKGRYSTFFVAEYGGTGYWYRFTGTARLVKRTEVGIHSQRAYGTGPFVRISLGRGFMVWASLVEGPQSLVGVLKSF